MTYAQQITEQLLATLDAARASLADVAVIRIDLDAETVTLIWRSGAKTTHQLEKEPAPQPAKIQKKQR